MIELVEVYYDQMRGKQDEEIYKPWLAETVYDDIHLRVFLENFVRLLIRVERVHEDQRNVYVVFLVQVLERRTKNKMVDREQIVKNTNYTVEMKEANEECNKCKWGWQMRNWIRQASEKLNETGK